MNNKGQSILVEYTMIFFVVIAALVAITVFVQRSLEARAHDARNYMIDSVMGVCNADANCIAATGGNIYHEYEPYYSVMTSNLSQTEDEKAGATNGSNEAIGAIYTRATNETTQSASFSWQLPPECANMPSPLPCYCTPAGCSN